MKILSPICSAAHSGMKCNSSKVTKSSFKCGCAAFVLALMMSLLACAASAPTSDAVHTGSRAIRAETEELPRKSTAKSRNAPQFTIRLKLALSCALVTNSLLLACMHS